MKRLLIANRGEIAIRIARAAADLGVETVAVYSQDDATSLHVKLADQSVALNGVGPRAYLDAAALVAAAAGAGCDAVHPGYGFLSESAAFSRACGAAGLTFVGGSPDALDLFGDKARARSFAAEHGVPLARGTEAAASLDEVRALQAAVGGPIMIKALAGGGGRGMRVVAAGEDPAAAYETCAREAEGAFGDGRLYAEAVIPRARHIEVQIAADGTDAVAIHDRECSIQRRRQKLIEVAPAIGLAPEVRAALQDASVRMARAAKLRGLATFEYLLDAGDGRTAAFIETNPRLQVEHTVTEAVTGLDLVQIQLRLARGESLASCGLGDGPPPVAGAAIQLRVNLESLSADGQVSSGAGGILSRYEAPSGPGVRVDGFGYGGYRTNPAFDSLIAKLVVQGPTLAAAAARAGRAAAEFRIEGAPSTLPLLRAVLEQPEFLEGRADTNFLEDHLAALLARAAALTPDAVVEAAVAGDAAKRIATPPGTQAAAAPLRGTIVSLDVAAGDAVAAGQPLAVLEAMKMQHVVAAPVAGVLHSFAAAVGETMDEGAPLAFIEPGEASDHTFAAEEIDLELIRPDLAEVQARIALTLDANRPDAIARRRRNSQRTARENLDDLFDDGTFKEFGGLAIAAQKRRRSVEDLQINTPADGIVTGVGEVGGARCVALAYDFTVLAGTQGHFSHKKTDRILEFAEHWKLPVVWYTEGGGGRPGDVDVGGLSASSLDTTSFTTFARMSGVAPRIAINSGRCFAGNAVFFGCADITIATEYSNIGLGGPAMIEGGGLGVFTPDEIGPSAVQYANGALDLLVADEAAATAAARQLLGVFQGATDDWTCADQRTLRHLIPENRVRAYDVRRVIETLADTGSWIELRGGYGKGMITGFLRVEGRPLGLIANDPRHLGGAIDSEGAEKGGRFLQLCDAFGVPVVSLCDTPGFMVGPDSEATAAIRRGSRLFVVAAGMSVPLFAVVLRKGYGLGAQAMTGGDFSAAAFTIAWPTAEFGPMGLEGAVRLGYRKELEAETDLAARDALFQKLVGRMYQTGKAISVAQVGEIDAVIDPAETRDWLVRGLKSCPARTPGVRPRSFIDVW
ncbi:MAG: carbamoyl-phosphate synthase large subunit [Alphaproteobacteria bacterium]|nr:carbamoyl-phosphate synthase large subunit [Alphaproteobacteria bacterium]MBU1515877.1 carbamoyl-phosphate synthase large subunit [Alphaproteobacteria bacterium]MBU2094099.1 carbamoyl-phosphate synthase large subunit [Alphaproteobacteria bacterium]MBU2151451.1 carbamoyl-phosphate synthase large subunit [Alphaproteobacteria bacterium]MBU2305273.1 carbamoyl-phosphate synthase large subunit [Alphaproteobacteria bacterium]